MKIFAVEPTNNCNAKCSFCPHSNKNLHFRKRGFIKLKMIDKIIEITKADTISINGLGEPLLHKKIDIIVQKFTAAKIKTLLNTNGKLLDQNMYNKLNTAGLTRLIVTCDYYPWTKSLNEHGIKPEYIVVDREPEYFQIKKELYDWAGRIGNLNREKVKCSYIENNWIQIMWDGTIVRCCQDFNADEPLGHINNLTSVKNITINICKKCQGYRFDNALVVGNYKDE